MLRAWPPVAAFGLWIVAGGGDLAGQTAGTTPPRTAMAVAGAHYRAGWLHRVLLGSHYRDLWATPIVVPVLDLAAFAGGLTPSQCGGRRQTKSLRFLSGDRREFVFRSVDKDPTLALPPELRATFVREIIQDQISSAHPGAPLVVAPLLDAAGVLHAEPQIGVLPDDPRLARFDCARPGLLGMIEERPTEGPDNEPGFAGAADLAGTKKLFEHLERDPDHRIDSRSFLAARLLDIYIGDWDRHQDQWRFARFDEGRVHWWRPIPRDRDQAFARLDGVLIWLTGFYQPQVVGFGDEYPSLFRLTFAGQVLDRRLLVELEKPVWDSTAAAIQARLTDSVIDAAVRRLPPEYYRTNGAPLARALRRRRDHLPEAAARLYALLAGEVDIHATDEREAAEIERLPGGRVRVRITAHGAPFYQRTFDRRETREIRLFLHGGDDRVMVRGTGSGPTVRVVGGGGGDTLVDSARAGRTRFYDDRGENRFVLGRGTSVDRRHYDAPPPDTSTLGRPRDWGARSVPFTWVSYGSDIGVFVGGGVTRTGYGFRQLPYRSRLTVRAGYATGAASYRAELTDEIRGLAPRLTGTVHLRASGIDVVRFYGFGNATPDTAPDQFYKIRQQQFLIESTLTLALSRAASFSLGPVFKFSETEEDTARFIGRFPPYGSGHFSQAGAAVGLRLDTRDRAAAASRGVFLSLRGSVYPAALDVQETFGAVRAEAATYLTAPVPTGPTLALRVGGQRVWGRYPFHEAAYVGGATTVRGFREHRFAGDAAVFGNAELRLFLAKFFLLLPVDLGVFGLTDAGRVYLAGETSDRWHAAAGGGLWLAFLNRAGTISVSAARSAERTGIYVRAGFAF